MRHLLTYSLYSVLTPVFRERVCRPSVPAVVPVSAAFFGHKLQRFTVCCEKCSLVSVLTFSPTNFITCLSFFISEGVYEGFHGLEKRGST